MFIVIIILHDDEDGIHQMKAKNKQGCLIPWTFFFPLDFDIIKSLNYFC